MLGIGMPGVEDRNPSGVTQWLMTASMHHDRAHRNQGCGQRQVSNSSRSAVPPGPAGQQPTRYLADPAQPTAGHRMGMKFRLRIDYAAAADRLLGDRFSLRAQLSGPGTQARTDGAELCQAPAPSSVDPQ